MRDTKGSKRWFNVGTAILVVVVIGLLVLMACDGGGNGGNGTPRPWTVRYGYPTTGIGGIVGIDPATTVAGIVSVQTAESLFRGDPDTLEVVPSLATGYEVAENLSYIDYTIRQGIKFHNGDNVTAEDVKFSYDRMHDYDLVEALSLIYDRFIDHVEIIGTYQVRVHFNEWSWNWLTSSPVIIPKNYIEDVGWEEWAEEPVLTGPFKIVDWQRDLYVHYEKAFPEEGHWYYGTDVPNYDELRIWSVVEPTTRLAMLKTGELDASHIPPANIPDVENDPNLISATSEYSSAWSVIFYDWANNESPLSDPDVRRAVSLAIDREAIAENVMNGAVEPWGSYWAPYTLGYRYREPDPYDLVEAQNLLAGAGYPEGFTTTFAFPLDQQLASEAVIASLANAGINAVTTPYEPTTWGMMLYNDEHVGMGYIHLPGWYGRTYPDSIWSDEVYGWAAQVSRDIPEVADIFDQMVTAANEEELEQAAWAAEDLVFELEWKIPVWAIHAVFAYGPTIENWNPGWPGDEYTQNLIILHYKG